MSKRTQAQGLFDRKIIAAAAIDALRKLNPRALAKNPVIFVTEVVSLLVTLFFVRDLITHDGVAPFTGQIAAWLWFTVLFANFAEAVAEGRGKAQADALRRTRSDTHAKRYNDPENLDGLVEGVNALDLQVGDVVLVEAGELIPGDGDIQQPAARQRGGDGQEALGAARRRAEPDGPRSRPGLHAGRQTVGSGPAEARRVVGSRPDDPGDARRTGGTEGAAGHRGAGTVAR